MMCQINMYLNSSYFDTDEATYKVVKNEEKEDAVVDNVRYCGSFALNAPKKICITIRIPVSRKNLITLYET